LHTAVDAYIFCELFGSTANRTKPADIPQVYVHEPGLTLNDRSTYHAGENPAVIIVCLTCV
jgi:hypothetical protein